MVYKAQLDEGKKVARTMQDKQYRLGRTISLACPGTLQGEQKDSCVL